MVKRGNWYCLMLILFVGLASASINITQPMDIYNFGDNIFTTVNLNPSSVAGSFEIKLVCDNGSAVLYKIAPANSAFVVNQLQTVNHKILLTKEFIGNLNGSCNIRASIGTEMVSTNNFLLTNDIMINGKLDKYSYDPAEAITINLEVVKANGKPLNGFAEFSGAKTFTKTVVEGKLQEVFATTDTTEAGVYPLDVFVYDSDENGILNQKNFTISFEIKQVAKSISISLSSTEINPGKNFEFGADLYDQSGKIMESQLSAILISPTGEERTTTLNSSSSSSFLFATNDTSGIWRLIVSQGRIGSEKEVNLKAVAKLDLKLWDNSSLLEVKNVGNAVFNDSISVLIGNETEVLELNILPGEIRKFNLQAPKGYYDVKIEAGDSSVEKNLFLTGNAVAVKPGTGVGWITRYPLIMVFIVVILVLLGAVLFLKYKKTHFLMKDRITPEKKENLNVISAKTHMMERKFLDLAKSPVNEAESKMNMKGNKDFCSVVSINIPNYNSLQENAKTQLTNFVNDSKGSGVVDWKGQHILLIYSPLLTKTYKNEITAVKSALKILSLIDEYNKKFSDKIQVNVGIHAGELVSSLNAGKLDYTSMGNTIILTKRISDMSQNMVLVSEAFRNKLVREIKVDVFKPLGENKVFRVTRVADIEANQQKLNDLLKRMSFS